MNLVARTVIRWRTASANSQHAGCEFRGQFLRGMMRVHKVLVVDDEAQMRRVLRASLIVHGYDVIEASSGEEALKTLNDERCDLVLLDLNLPGIDGIDTCRAIRSTSGIPVIVVSIRDSEKDRAAALAAGADGYVAKPFSVDTILSRMQDVSGQKHP
jgi:two-component system, OmpR family, KDP operon response regulator KdpE